jgi:hypothetical protein
MHSEEQQRIHSLHRGFNAFVRTCMCVFFVYSGYVSTNPTNLSIQSSFILDGHSVVKCNLLRDCYAQRIRFKYSVVALGRTQLAWQLFFIYFSLWRIRKASQVCVHHVISQLTSWGCDPVSSRCRWREWGLTSGLKGVHASGHRWW